MVAVLTETGKTWEEEGVVITGGDGQARRVLAAAPESAEGWNEGTEGRNLKDLSENPRRQDAANASKSLENSLRGIYF